MEPIMASIFGAVATAIAAGIAKKIVEKFSEHANREILIKAPSGKEKTFEFEPGISKSQMLSSIQAELDLESSVKSILDSYLVSVGSKTARPGKRVDFIADMERAKVAFEVKSDIRRFNSDLFQRYLSDEPNLSKLVFLTPTPVSQKIREQAKPLEKAGKLRFVVLNRDADQQAQFKQIADALSVQNGA